MKKGDILETRMVLGAPVIKKLSSVTGQPIIINRVGGSPFDGTFHESDEKRILNGEFDYAVALRATKLVEDGALKKILKKISELSEEMK